MSKVSDEKTEEKASEEKKAEYKGMKNLWSVVSNRSKRLKLFHFGTIDFKLQNLSQRIKVSASQDSLRVRKHLWLIGMDVDKFTCKSMINENINVICRLCSGRMTTEQKPTKTG